MGMTETQPSSSRIKIGWMVLIVMAFTSIVQAQQIKSSVKLLLERLPLEKQQRLKNFAGDIETYLNDYDWTGENLEEPIPITVQIFLTDVSVSYEERYTGTFLITNNSDLQYFDKYWRFPYQAGDPLIHNENVYEPFTGFINFYVFLILAGEYDKYGEYLGARFYEKAKHISDQAQFDAAFNLGWKERAELISYLNSEENKSYRKMIDLFFLGMSYVGEEDSTARKYCGQALSHLEDIIEKSPNHKQATQFLQAHHLDFIDIFKDHREVMERLIYIDPDNTETYEKYMERLCGRPSRVHLPAVPVPVE